MFAGLAASPRLRVRFNPKTSAAMNPIVAAFSLTEWWGSFDLTVQIFYGIGLVAGAVIAVLAVLSMLGLDHDHLDSIGDVGGDAADGTSLLSVKPILGFLLGFGWAGGAVRAEGYSLPISCAVAIAAGGLAMGAIFLLVRSTTRLKSDGTLRKANAVGQVGTVYINIPGGAQAGGQITVSVGDRTITLQAIQDGATTLPAGTKVRVLEFLGTDTVRVASLSEFLRNQALGQSSPTQTS
jgi:membrane protein implicated in regulation of membrane protease activity